MCIGLRACPGVDDGAFHTLWACDFPGARHEDGRKGGRQDVGGVGEDFRRTSKRQDVLMAMSDGYTRHSTLTVHVVDCCDLLAGESCAREVPPCRRRRPSPRKGSRQCALQESVTGVMRGQLGYPATVDL